MRRRKRGRKPSTLYLLYSKNTWNRKDELPDIGELENIYYRNRDKVKVEDDDVPSCSSYEQSTEHSISENIVPAPPF